MPALALVPPLHVIIQHTATNTRSDARRKTSSFRLGGSRVCVDERKSCDAAPHAAESARKHQCGYLDMAAFPTNTHVHTHIAAVVEVEVIYLELT